MKKLSFLLTVLILFFSFTGCEYYESMRKISGITYENEIFDGVQNHESYNGLRAHASDAKISYFENTDKDEFYDNFLTIIDEGHDFIWCLENSGKDVMLEVGVKLPEVLFGIVDTKIENIPSNFVTVSFKDHEGGFLAGYIAAKSSPSGKLGFLAGKESEVSLRYETGFIAGANYAASLTGNPVQIETLYINDDYNKDLAKSSVLSLYNERECDVVFHTLQTGAFGAIEGAVEADKLIICSGTDQSSYGTENVLVSVIKNTKVALSNVIGKYLEGENIGGTNFEFGVKDRLISLSRNNRMLDKKIYKEATDLRGKISNGEIVVPKNREELNLYLEQFKEL